MGKLTNLQEIDPKIFQHPSDIKAINALKVMKGFDVICHKMMEYGYEKVQYINLIGNHVKVTSKQCPRIYDIFKDAVSALGVEEPTLFIGQNSDMNAYTSGSEKPFIVLNTELVKELSDDEIQVVIAHELGHIKCKHVIYIMVSEFITDFVGAVSGATLGLGGLLSAGLELALYNWYRKAELSCDRAALLATGNLDACVSTLMKLAGGSKEIALQMDPDEFVKQADLYKELDSSLLNKVYKFLLVRYQSHPFAVLRAKEITEWANSEQYKNILSGNYVDYVPPVEQEILASTPNSEQQQFEEAAKETLKNVTSGFKGFLRRK